ncbi:MAG: hypothetical protein KJ053_03105 [Dehalococcoidia bacterium]|nr:hypothetical protein [Dehalococcoidia bacterium]
MERIRIRYLALATMLGALAVLPLAAGDAHAGAGRQHELVVARAEPNVSVQPAIVSGKENTSAIAQNRGSANATIAMDIYTPGGVPVPSASRVYQNVPPGGTRVFAQATNEGLATGFRGVGILSSDQPINALLVRDIESPSGQKSYSIHNAYPSGGNTVTLPYISNALGGEYNTRFAIANTGTSDACVSITYAFVPGAGAVGAGGRAPVTDTGPGGTGCTTGYRVPVGGQVTFAPTAVDGATPMPSTTANTLMAATVTSTGSPVTVAVDAYVSSGRRKLASYDGFIVGGAGSSTDDVGTAIAIPLALKTPDGYYSQILLSNPNASQATATITYSGNTGTHSVSVTVPANGTANHSVYSDSTVPVGFVGAATVTSDQSLAAVLFRAKMTSAGSFVDEDLYTAVNGVPTDRATTKVRFPLIFRRAYATGGLNGYNSWVSVSVPGGGTANLTIEAVNDPTSGAPGCAAAYTSTVTKTITGSFIFYQNLDADNGFSPNPACFWGGITITSNVPINAIGNVTTDLRSGDNDGLYNGFSE